MPTESLYDRLGGRDALAAVVDDFYDRVLADERLAHYFDDVDMADQRRHQTSFLVYATDGPASYDGQSMRAAHDHLDVGDREFDAILGHLDEALEAAGVDENDRVAVVGRVEDFRPEIVGAAP
jgi:hemoglobin